MDREEHRAKLAQYIDTELGARKFFTRFWSFAHYGTLFSAAILSASAALVLQLKTILLICTES